MPPVDYLALRFIRKQIPQSIMHWLLQQRLIVRPGLESRDPTAAAIRYADALKDFEITLEGKTIMVFGYGGYIGVGAGLLALGAQHVVLLDPYASIDDQRNEALVDQYPEFVRHDGKQVMPDPSMMTVWHDTLQSYADRAKPRVDLLLSSSVMEHVASPEAEAEQTARVLKTGAAQLHFVDLRDHFFKYPFEMLCYSEETWQRFLNPGSNLNRYRAWQYEAAFMKYFEEVHWITLEREEAAFESVKPRIRRDFLTDDDRVNSVTQISLFAK